MNPIVSAAKSASTLYRGARAVVLGLAALYFAMHWAATRPSTTDLEAVRQEQRENFRKLDRWAVRNFGDPILNEPDVRTTSAGGAHGGRP